MPTPLDPAPTALQAAAALIAGGRAAEAARELNAVVRAAPTYAAAHVLLAKAREASGDSVRALDAWHRAHFLVPSSPLVRRERQRLLDALAPPMEPAVPWDETEADEPDGPERLSATETAELAAEAALLSPLPTPEASGDSIPDVPEADSWAIVEEEPDDFPKPPPTPVAPDLLAPNAPEAAPLPPAGPEVTDATEIGGGLDHDLDALIRDLEHAPRITPDPDFQGPDAVSGEDDVDDMASETLAQIYAAQKQYAEAAVVYERLARQTPDRAAELNRRAEEMRERAK